MDETLVWMIVICIAIITIYIFCYNDNNKRKAKANADAMKEMLKELEQERAEKKDSEK